MAQQSFGSTVFATCVAWPLIGQAHHSRAQFDTDAVQVIQGTVTGFFWTNPHVSIAMESESREWHIEADAIPILSRSGWSADTLQRGAEITARVHPNRDPGIAAGLMVAVRNANGEWLSARRARDGQAELVAGARATSLSGTWELPFGEDTGDFSRRWAAVALTEKGAAGKAAFSPEDRPAGKCIGTPTPQLMAMPYLNQIELQADRAILRNEFFNTERIVYMDGRQHPENGSRTNQGHSIGWWEEGVLVVDTVAFEDHRAPIRGRNEGVPSGAQRHVVERYRLNEDGTRIIIDFVVEDPEYLAEPFRGRFEWVHAPHLQMLGFNCQPY